MKLRPKALPWSVVTFVLIFGIAQPGIAEEGSHPIVTWTPAKIELALFVGTAQAVRVSFRVSEPVEDLHFSVVPELQPFVIGIQPEQFAHVAPGSDYAIRISFVASAQAQLGHFEGTLHPKLGSSARTLPATLKIALDVVQPTAEVIPAAPAMPSPDLIITDAQTGAQLVSEELLVRFKEGTDEETVSLIVERVGGVFVGSSTLLNTYQVRFAMGLDLPSLLRIADQLRLEPEVQFAVPSLLLKPAVCPPEAIQTSIGCVPTDPFYNDWGISPPGNTWGHELVRLPKAWELTTGEHNTATAVVDGTFLATHEDLKEQVTSVDNLSFLADPSHGTAVAGILAARANNVDEFGSKVGIAGVLWNTRLQLYGCGYGDGLHPLNCAHQFVQAVLRNARAVNFSGGSLGTLLSGLYSLPVLLAQALGDHVTFVFAAGNDGIDYSDVSPASLALVFPNVVAVGGVDRDKSRFTFKRSDGKIDHSNFGDGLLYAPALDIPTTGSTHTGAYGLFNETSAAAPFVAGVAGLMFSRNPNLTGTEVKERLFLSGDCTTGNDEKMAGGRILDAFAAVELADREKDEIIELLSGVDKSNNPLPQGGRDAFTEVKPAGWSDFYDAIVSDGSPGGFYTPGGWVCEDKSQPISSANPFDIDVTFRRTFELPMGFTDAVLRLWVVPDDGTRITLNGNGNVIATVNLLEGGWKIIGGGAVPDKPEGADVCMNGSSFRRCDGCPYLIEIRQSTCSTCFKAGINTLEFHVVNHPFEPLPGTYGVPQWKGGLRDGMNLEYEGYVAFKRPQ